MESIFITFFALVIVLAIRSGFDCVVEVLQEILNFLKEDR